MEQPPNISAPGNTATDSYQALKTKLNKETAKINWQELQRHYASGAVIAVANGNDLIEVACQFSLDNKEAVEQWLTSGAMVKVDDQQAAQWFEQQATLWAVVVAPWVLVQEIVQPL
ncbi:hypothetical protein BST96_00755 [Oceanicoccus sagamiensis]|uniref:DUF2288 domain-containing protein n=1 Tax=Oceanicoccus sagamiensis TaxID=716816 RepID=A0A1X9NKA0_9GAMM|nr:hypothetical protein BST96_00755 [Oceanicoccus sagamiensis]